jgi:hypothetical protein
MTLYLLRIDKRAHFCYIFSASILAVLIKRETREAEAAS